MAVSNKLAQLSGMWKKVQPIASGMNTIADGEYVASLKEIKIGESKKGRLQAVSTYEIADGEYTGKTTKKFDGLEDEANLGHFKHYISVLGFDLGSKATLWQEELDAQIAEDQTLWNITIKTNGEYQNMYNNGPSELTVGEEEGVEEIEVEEVNEEGEEEVVEEEVEEEEVAEEEVEEEEQEVVVPKKKPIASAKPIAKAPVKALPKKILAKR